MSPSYDASAWNVWQSVIGTRYPVWRCMHGFSRTTTTERLATSCGSLSGVSVEDYATALAAWQKISLHDMRMRICLLLPIPPRRQEMVQLGSLATTGRTTWTGKQCPLLVLHAQRYIPGQPELALSDLTRQSILRLLPTLTLRGRQFIATS